MMIAPNLANEVRVLRGSAESRSAAEMEQAAREWIAENCPYQYYFRYVEFQFYKGVLTLHGRVHSFYLKQVLQSVLGELPEIERVDNHVEVVSSVGLSSVKPK
jgi:hypothetical protein